MLALELGICWQQYRRLDVPRIGNRNHESIPRGIHLTCLHPRANRSPAPRYCDALVLSSPRRSPSPPPVSGRASIPIPPLAPHHPSPSASGPRCPPISSLRRQAALPSLSFLSSAGRTTLLPLRPAPLLLFLVFLASGAPPPLARGRRLSSFLTAGALPLLPPVRRPLLFPVPSPSFRRTAAPPSSLRDWRPSPSYSSSSRTAPLLHFLAAGTSTLPRGRRLPLLPPVRRPLLFPVPRGGGPRG